MQGYFAGGGGLGRRGGQLWEKGGWGKKGRGIGRRRGRGGGAVPPGIFSGKGKFGGKREKKNVKLLLLLIVLVEY